MASLEVWVISVLGVLSAAFAGYLVLTKILPKIKGAMDMVVHDNNAISGLMLLLITYVILFVLRKILGSVAVIGDNWTKYVVAIGPGVDILIHIIPYLAVFMVALTIVIVIKTKPKPKI